MNERVQTTPPVKLKGVGDSFWVTLDPHQPVKVLQNEITKLFERLKHLSINARVVIDPGASEGFDDLIKDLGSFLKDKFQVGLVSGPPEKRSKPQERIRRRDMGQSWQHHRSDVLLLAGRVRSGQKVSARKHLIILGDVNPGAEIIAKGDIFVMGRLCGTATAGTPSNEDAIVMALDFRPTQIQIGGLVAAGLPPSAEKTAEFAHVEEGAIVVEDYLSVNPFGRLPWPEVR